MISAGRGRTMASAILAACLAACLAATGAAAHPHVFIIAKSTLVFGKTGKIDAIRQAWQFDEMYSAFVTDGLGVGGAPASKEQLAPLAKTNVEQLAEYDWFTSAKKGSQKLEFEPPVDYSLEEGADKIVTLRFTLPLKTPGDPRPALSLLIYDPTYFVAFEFADKDPVALEGAPKGCSTNIVRPGALAAPDQSKLTESTFTNMSPGVDFGAKLASRVIVACP